MQQQKIILKKLVFNVLNFEVGVTPWFLQFVLFKPSVVAAIKPTNFTFIIITIINATAVIISFVELK
jgi:hypothetical protein